LHLVEARWPEPDKIAADNLFLLLDFGIFAAAIVNCLSAPPVV
jgi:hypothetical protein